MSDNVKQPEQLEGAHILEPYGELFNCKVCMGLEGSLATHCPGELMTREQSDAVYAGNLDYRVGEGWVNKLSPMGRDLVKSKIYAMLNGREDAPKSDAEIILFCGTTKEEYYPIKQQCLKFHYEK